MILRMDKFGPFEGQIFVVTKALGGARLCGFLWKRSTGCTKVASFYFREGFSCLYECYGVRSSMFVGMTSRGCLLRKAP